MSGKGQISGASARRRGGISRFYLRLLGLCLLAAALAGCQSEASTAQKAPATQSETSTAATAQDQPAASSGKQAEPVELKATVLAPRITVAKPVIDLGEVGTDTKQTGKFEFKNTGNSPLKILEVYSCCGVTTRGLEAGQEFAPGEGGALEFDYHTISSPTKDLERVLRLQTNDPEHKIVALTITADIVRRVECEPLRLRLFLKRENAGCSDIKIRSLDGKPFSISGFKSTANAITVDFDPNVQATEFTLQPRVDMQTLQRNIRGLVSIDLTHPECSNVRLPFDVLPEFTVNPAHLMVFNLRPGQPIQREIWILSNYREDFEVEAVSSQKDIIKLVEKRKVDNRYQLKVEINVPEREGENTMVADMLEVKIKDGETVSIPFRGFYVGR